MTKKELTLFFVWCWFELLKKREAHARYMREYYRKNPEKRMFAGRKYYRENREKMLAAHREWHVKHADDQKEYKRQYHIKNRAKLVAKAVKWQRENKARRSATLRIWTAKQQATNLWYKLRKNLATRVWWAMRAKSCKSENVLKLLGCSVEELKRHLEAQFRPGMSWSNYGEWHIDHIRPCASYDLTDPEQQRACFNFKNLQPLWAKDNLSKGPKYAPEP